MTAKRLSMPTRTRRAGLVLPVLALLVLSLIGPGCRDRRASTTPAEPVTAQPAECVETDAPPPDCDYAITTGNVRSRSLDVRVRATRCRGESGDAPREHTAFVRFTYANTPPLGAVFGSSTVSACLHLTAENDYTATLPLTELAAATSYQYDAYCGRSEPAAELCGQGDFRTTSYTADESAEQRKNLAFLLGVQELFAVPVPERSPLNTEITGVLARDGYDIYNLRFDSLPGLPVSASLYVPNDPAYPLPRPAVVCPHGHWPSPMGRYSRHVQARAVGLAKLGYVALTYDTLGQGERIGANGKREGYEFLSAAATWPGGPIPMGLQTYDLSRAVDYLASRPDLADLTNLAVTGASGGGSQAIYGAIFDKRIKVVVPVVWGGIADVQPFGCPDETVPLVDKYMEQWEILTLLHPARTLFLSATAIEEGMARSAVVTYRERGDEEIIRTVRLDTPHGYFRAHRERLYAWLSRWVLGVDAGETIPDPPGISDEMPLESEDDLTVGLPADRPTLVELTAGLRNARPPRKQPGSAADWTAYQAKALPPILDLLNFPDQPTTTPERVATSDKRESLVLIPDDLDFDLNLNDRVVSLPSRVSATLHKPSADPPYPVAIVVNPNEFPEGDPEYEAVCRPVDDRGLIHELVARGYAVLRVTQRYNDEPEFVPPYAHGRYFFESTVTNLAVGTGLPVFGRHVYDLTLWVDYLAGRKDVDGGRITIVGLGEGGPVALTAAAVDDRVSQCVVRDSRLGFGVRESDRHPPWAYPPRILVLGDLPQIASLIAPRGLVVADAVDDARRPLTVRRATGALAWTAAAYEALGVSDRLRIVETAGDAELADAMSAGCAAR